MFDYEHERMIRSGGNPDKALLVTFRYDIHPKTKMEVPFVNIFLSKNNTVDRPATEDDKKRFPDRWEAFQKGEEVPPEGLPISQVPFATPAEISICKTERIYTVEQLVETPDSHLQRANLLNFRYRCADLLKQLQDSHHIVDMREQLEKLQSQMSAVLEKNAELKAELDEERSTKPKKVGRPRKADGDVAGDSQ